MKKSLVAENKKGNLIMSMSVSSFRNHSAYSVQNKQNQRANKAAFQGNITVFLKKGRPIGSCPAGHENNWINHGVEKGMKSMQGEFERMMSSTDEEWNAWARKQAQTGKAELYP